MLKMGCPEVEISSGTGCTGAIRSVFEAQVALVHLGGHEIGHITLIWSPLRVAIIGSSKSIDI